MIRTPILVLGGGPVGLALARELAFHRVPVVVAEPRLTVERTRPRAKTTSARTMELFRRWGLSDAIRNAAALPLAYSNRVTFCTTVVGPEITHFDGVFGLDLADSDLVAEAGQQIIQPVVEEVLRADLAGLEDVTLLLGWRGTHIEEREHSVVVTLQNDDGDELKVEADYLIGADGARSAVRAAMGAQFEGAAAGRPNVNITFRSKELAARIPHAPSIHYWVLNPAAPGVVGPLDLDGTWWAISTGTETVADNAEAASLVRALVGADIDIQIIATDPWQARMLLADKYRSGRMFLAGDAAHQNPPWGGHGFNTGIGDAVNLGWKLAAVVNRWAPATLLDSYEVERRPIAQQTIEVAAQNMRALSSDLSDDALMTEGPGFERARDAAAATIQESKDAEFHSLGLVLGYGYGPESATQTSNESAYVPKASAGNRLPHALLRSGEPLYDRLGPELTVIGGAAAVASLREAAQRRQIPLSSLTEPEVIKHLDGGTLLVRPDQHIAWRGDGVDDPDAVLDLALRGFVDNQQRK